LIFTVGYFTWLGLRKMVINDERIAKGEPPTETIEDEKVLVWPDLVYTELIAMIVVTFILVVWAVALKAPLEQPATSAKAPNPSKAPWYFLGLQEMLVYYDPWMAGIVLPLMIINGLVAIPYIDFNQKGNGYFTFNQRKFAVTVFLIGFVVMWVTLIVLGTFLRGPNWNFFGPYENWDPHKVLPLNNVNLSDYFWLGLLKQPLPDTWYIRELPGIIVVLAYLFVLPPILARTVLRPFFLKMGFVRFILLVNLLQFMAALPLKMVLRWAINLKYIVYIPEYFFNI
jgi:Cytochrome b(C-terminal)/b6/petD